MVQAPDHGKMPLQRLDQPAQYRMGIDLKDPSDGADTESLSQSRNGPYQLVRINLLGVKRRPHGFEERAPATETHELSPASTIGMAVGADIPEVDPAVVRTLGMGAKVTGCIDLAATPTGARESGWRRAGQLRMRLTFLLTELVLWLARISRKWFGFTLAPYWLRRRRRLRAVTPPPIGQDNQ